MGFAGVAPRLTIPSMLRTTILLVLTSAAHSGCSSPEPRASFRSVDPKERTAAVLEAARTDDRDAIPELIETLDSDDPAQRMLAHRTLRRLTEQDFGYDYAASPAERRIATDRWEGWWRNETASSDVPDPADRSEAESADETGATGLVRSGDSPR